MRLVYDVNNDLKKNGVTNLKVAEDLITFKRIIEKAKTFISEVVMPYDNEL